MRRIFAIGLGILIFLGTLSWLLVRLQYHYNVMDVENYEPISTLEVPRHLPKRAKYPFVDVHSHQWFMPIQNLDKLVAEMDELNMAVMVNLSGYRGTLREWTLENVKAHQEKRFLVFVNLDYGKVGSPEWPKVALDELEAARKQGAAGLKVFKELGLSTTDAQGARLAVDDPRIDPIWEKCGELGMPVLIHSGEPSPFWSPKDRFNERWLELKQEPGRYRDPAKVASYEQILKEQHNVFRKHAKTKFIDAHLGWLGNDLARLGRLFDEMPNVSTELGAVLAELGRQPRFAREFLIKYQDRVMLGKDTYEKDEYLTYFRTLETADEYFDYYRKRHAHWKIYGLDLPDETLRHIYYKNALALFPQIDRSLFPTD